jgi:hypothetical protein
LQKNAGKHCPDLVEEYREGHFTDLSPVSNVQPIIDTLARYPQLKVYKATMNYGVDPGYYTAIINCIVYYKRVPFFNLYYSLFVTPLDIKQFGNIPGEINISTEPAVSRERAREIASEHFEFERCTLARLGIVNLSSDTVPNYRLVWRIEGAETGYPSVQLDAQNEVVYSKDDGIIID